ncbi:gastrokine-1-like protein [Turdus rufiventris]|nr:gastrokine-1-like protein [Turdus rufiventris]
MATAIGMAVGMAIGMAVGMAVTIGMAVGMAVAIGMAVGMAAGMAVGMAVGMAFGMAVQTNDQQIITGGDSQISISGGNSHISISGVSQSMSINSQTQKAIFEQKSNRLSWKTIWNYNTGVIATKVMQERACYISTMNRSEMPTFATLIKVAAERRNQVGFGRPAEKITFVTNGLVNNLSSYGSDVFSMCSGLTTYMAHEVYGRQYNQQSCVALNVVRLVELKYCRGNGGNYLP